MCTSSCWVSCTRPVRSLVPGFMHLSTFHNLFFWDTICRPSFDLIFDNWMIATYTRVYYFVLKLSTLPKRVDAEPSNCIFFFSSFLLLWHLIDTLFSFIASIPDSTPYTKCMQHEKQLAVKSDKKYDKKKVIG